MSAEPTTAPKTDNRKTAKPKLLTVAGFSCDPTTLKDALKRAKLVIDKGFSDMVLGQVLVTVEDGFAHLTATNLELFFRVGFPCKASAPAEFLLPPKVADVLAKSNSSTCDISVLEDSIRVTAGSLECEIPLSKHAVKDFPELPLLDKADFYLDIPVQRWTHLTGRLIACAEGSDKHPALGNLHLYDKEGLILEATNGKKLARVHTPWRPKDDRELLLPATALGKINRILGKAEGDPLMILFKDKIGNIMTGPYTFAVRATHDEYPDTDRVLADIEGGKRVSAIFAREDLKRALSRVTITSDVDVVKLTAPVGATELTVSTSSSENVTTRERIAISGEIEEEPFEITVNPALLSSVLDKTCTGDELLLEQTEEDAPLIVRDKDMTVIVMPIRK